MITETLEISEAKAGMIAVMILGTTFGMILEIIQGMIQDIMI
jgi:hypothetical protein